MLLLSEREPAKLFKTPPHNGFFIKSLFFATVFFKSTLQLQKQFFYHHQLIYYWKFFLRFLLLFSHTQSKHGLYYNFLTFFNQQTGAIICDKKNSEAYLCRSDQHFVWNYLQCIITQTHKTIFYIKINIFFLQSKNRNYLFF